LLSDDDDAADEDPTDHRLSRRVCGLLIAAASVLAWYGVFWLAWG